MILDERLRWMGFWMLDKMKGGKIREYYDQIRYAWKEGSSIEETDKRIRDLIAHAVRTTDFYKDYPEDIALRDLPVVNKDTFRQQYDRFISSTYKDADFLIFIANKLSDFSFSRSSNFITEGIVKDKIKARTNTPINNSIKVKPFFFITTASYYKKYTTNYKKTRSKKATKLNNANK